MEPNPSPLSTLLAEHAKLSHALAQVQHTDAQQEHLLCLLEADLRHQRLLYLLQPIGAVSDSFCTHLEGLILSLVGFSQEEIQQDPRLVASYFALLHPYLEMPLPAFWENVRELAAEVYVELLYQRVSRKWG